MYFLLNYLIIYMTKVQVHANNYRQRSPSQVCGHRIYYLLVSALIALFLTIRTPIITFLSHLSGARPLAIYLLPIFCLLTSNST